MEIEAITMFVLVTICFTNGFRHESRSHSRRQFPMYQQLGPNAQRLVYKDFIFITSLTKLNKTPRGVSVGCIGLRIASQGQDE